MGILIWVWIVLASVWWGGCNREWGMTDGFPKIVCAVLLFFPTFFVANQCGLSNEYAAGAGLIAMMGDYLGRISDGVRGTFLQKALRGWQYAGIPIGFTLLTGNLWALLPLAFFWQGGLIEWVCSHLVKSGSDYTALAEPTDGTVRGFLNLAALHLAVAGGVVIHFWSWA